MSLVRLQAFLRTSAMRGRDVERIAPFTATFTQHDALKYLSYAIPDDGAEPDQRAIDRLRAAFRSRERLPRLEWLEETAPAVAGALAAAGMREELRTPLMACAAFELVDAPSDVAELRVEVVDSGNLRELVTLQRAAFGEPPLAEGESPRAPSGGAVIAYLASEPVAAASWTRVIDGVSELVGVATAARWRRRGLAGVLTAAAAREAFGAGATQCILSPGDETAMRVYARAGFRRVATMLHWSDP